MPSFDVVSSPDIQEIDNAINNTKREVDNRFDFKNTNSTIERNDFSITIAFDMLAKRSFHLRSKITYYIQLFAIKHSHETPDVMGMQRMILYNQKAHFALINASIELAVFYFLAEKFIKTAGLFNFVLNVLHKLIPKVFLCFLCMAICLRSFDSILAR